MFTRQVFRAPQCGSFRATWGGQKRVTGQVPPLPAQSLSPPSQPHTGPGLDGLGTELVTPVAPAFVVWALLDGVAVPSAGTLLPCSHRCHVDSRVWAGQCGQV